MENETVNPTPSELEKVPFFKKKIFKIGCAAVAGVLVLAVIIILIVSATPVAVTKKAINAYFDGDVRKYESFMIQSSEDDFEDEDSYLSQNYSGPTEYYTYASQRKIADFTNRYGKNYDCSVKFIDIVKQYTKDEFKEYVENNKSYYYDNYDFDLTRATDMVQVRAVLLVSGEEASEAFHVTFTLVKVGTGWKILSSGF